MFAFWCEMYVNTTGERKRERRRKLREHDRAVRERASFYCRPIAADPVHLFRSANLHSLDRHRATKPPHQQRTAQPTLPLPLSTAATTSFLDTAVTTTVARSPPRATIKIDLGRVLSAPRAVKRATLALYNLQ